MSERKTTGMISAFTPAFDVIAQDPDLGPVAALVFGRVWRYCHMNGVCRASRERMAQEVGLHRKTFDRWLTRLCEKEYLEDMATWTRGRSHWYRDTGKVKMPVRKGVGEGRGSLNGAQLGQRVHTLGTESPNCWDRQSHKDTIREKREKQQHAGVLASSASSLLCSRKLPQPADAPGESEADPQTSGAGNGVAANLRAMAEYDIQRTQDALAVAMRSGMTPSLIHDWGQHVRARPDVDDKPAYLVTVLRTATQPPNERNNDCGHHPAVNRRRRRGEYPSYTVSRRDALWAQHKDRYLVLVDQGLGSCRDNADIAQTLGLTTEEVYILHDAYSAWLSLQETPLDLSTLEEDV